MMRIICIGEIYTRSQAVIPGFNTDCGACIVHKSVCSVDADVSIFEAHDFRKVVNIYSVLYTHLFWYTFPESYQCPTCIAPRKLVYICGTA